MTETEPRAHTAEEARHQLMRHLAYMALYWAKLDKTPLEKCNGLVFSILNIFDGCAAGFPAINLSLAPHESDKEFHRSEGENWFEPGQIINETMLHEMWHEHEFNA